MLLDDRKGVTAIETALVLPPFLTLLFMIIEVGIYFILQTSLDLGVLTTGEVLQTAMAGGSSCNPQNAAPAAGFKATIAANGGAAILVANLAVDVRQLTTLSAGNQPVVDGSYEQGGSGSVLVLRAQTTTPFLPGTSVLTMMSASIIRCPLY